jgi:hypothetical protein
MEIKTEEEVTTKEVIKIHLKDDLDVAFIFALLRAADESMLLDDFAEIVKAELDELKGYLTESLKADTVEEMMVIMKDHLEIEVY